jgi:hypothetical protein
MRLDGRELGVVVVVVVVVMVVMVVMVVVGWGGGV